MAGAASREGLYVAATRGRESVRIFVPDREAFLDAGGLRSEARTSALEFTRAIRPAIRTHLAQAWIYLRQVRLQVIAYIARNPDQQFLPPPEIHLIPVRVRERIPTPAVSYENTPSHRHFEAPSQGSRMRL